MSPDGGVLDKTYDQCRELAGKPRSAPLTDYAPGAPRTSLITTGA